MTLVSLFPRHFLKDQADDQVSCKQRPEFPNQAGKTGFALLSSEDGFEVIAGWHGLVP